MPTGVWVRVPPTALQQEEIMKHGSDLKFCSCKACNRGLHTEWGGFEAKMARRKLRHKVKQALKTGQDIIEKISVPYTD